MSTPGTQKRRKQEGEKTRKRIPAESPRKKTSGKVRGGQTWVPLPSNLQVMVPIGKAEKYPEEIGDILGPRPQGARVGGLIAENTLYAVIVAVESIQLSERCNTIINEHIANFNCWFHFQVSTCHSMLTRSISTLRP